MAMTRCKANLHFYDKEKHATCPYCEDMTGNSRPVVQLEAVQSDVDDTCIAPTITLGPQKVKATPELDATVICRPGEEPTKQEQPTSESLDQQDVRTVLAVGGVVPEMREEPVSAEAPYEQAAQAEPKAGSAMPDLEQKTVMHFKESATFNPVTGWLVLVDGPERGRDYRIRNGMNEIAREDNPEVDIVIKGDASISRRNHALIQYDPEDNGFYLIRMKNEAVKVNDVPLKRPIRLNAYDRIQFGETRLVFVPLCSDTFQWTANV